MQVSGRLTRWQLWLNQFSFSIENAHGAKNSMVDSLTCECANGDYHKRTPVGKGGNVK